VGGGAGDGKEAIEEVHALSPDVIVMDITMRNLNGVEAIQQILSDSPHTKVMALSIHASKRFVKDMQCEFTDLALELNPQFPDKKHAQQSKRRIQILTAA
jgi:CheY-like chemotaxis protein